MQDTDQKRSEMLAEFVSGYMEKLFYFCLKKTGGQPEAEDLTQEIALQIVSSLNRGIIPENLSAWVWQIARNRYARWAKRKHERAESVSGTDISEFEIEDGSAPVLEEMIREEEIRLLYDATLLEKQGDKYVTNFFILDRDCRIDIYNALRKEAGERSRLLRAFIEDRLGDLRSLGIAGESVSDNAIRWWLVPYLIDLLILETVRVHGEYEPPKRANGESWEFVGYELTPLLDHPVLCHNGSGDGKKNQFWAYSYGEYRTGAEVCLSYRDTITACGFFRKYLRREPLSDLERALAEKDDNLLCHYAGGYLVPDTVVLTEETEKRIAEMLRSHPGFPALYRNAADTYAALEAIFGRYTNPVLNHTLCYNIRMELYEMRMMAIRDLVGEGFLTLPEDPDHSTIGMYFIVD